MVKEVKLELNSWEKKSLKKVTKKYIDLYVALSKESKKCFRIDSHTIFNSDTKELTQQQKNKIVDYWHNYTKDFDINYHKYYIDKTGMFDVRFIPDDIFAGYIDPYLNNREIEPGIADKNYFDLFLKGFKMPKTYVRLINGIYEDENYNIIPRCKVLEKLTSIKKFVVKPSTASYGGKNVTFFENATLEEIENFININKTRNLIFQEIVDQHESTASIHPKSLNTIRIMTLIIDNDVKVLPCAFRMGVGAARVDNASFGGIYCKIFEDGTLSDFAYDALGHKFYKHPDGKEFSSVKIDCLDKVKDLVKKAAQRFPHFRLIGWDIGIDKEGEPIIIEANLTMSGLDVIETICGPLFGDYTDMVLNEVFKNPIKKEISMDISQYV